MLQKGSRSGTGGTARWQLKWLPPARMTDAPNHQHTLPSLTRKAPSCPLVSGKHGSGEPRLTPTPHYSLRSVLFCSFQWTAWWLDSHVLYEVVLLTVQVPTGPHTVIDYILPCDCLVATNLFLITSPLLPSPQLASPLAAISLSLYL